MGRVQVGQVVDVYNYPSAGHNGRISPSNLQFLFSFTLEYF
jgi:hypothetical protein